MEKLERYNKLRNELFVLKQEKEIALTSRSYELAAQFRDQCFEIMSELDVLTEELFPAKTLRAANTPPTR